MKMNIILIDAYRLTSKFEQPCLWDSDTNAQIRPHSVSPIAITATGTSFASSSPQFSKYAAFYPTISGPSVFACDE